MCANGMKTGAAARLNGRPTPACSVWGRGQPAQAGGSTRGSNGARGQGTHVACRQHHPWVDERAATEEGVDVVIEPQACHVTVPAHRGQEQLACSAHRQRAGQGTEANTPRDAAGRCWLRVGAGTWWAQTQPVSSLSCASPQPCASTAAAAPANGSRIAADDCGPHHWPAGRPATRGVRERSGVRAWLRHPPGCKCCPAGMPQRSYSTQHAMQCPAAGHGAAAPCTHATRAPLVPVDLRRAAPITRGGAALHSAADASSRSSQTQAVRSMALDSAAAAARPLTAAPYGSFQLPPTSGSCGQQQAGDV